MQIEPVFPERTTLFGDRHENYLLDRDGATSASPRSLPLVANLLVPRRTINTTLTRRNPRLDRQSPWQSPRTLRRDSLTQQQFVHQTSLLDPPLAHSPPTRPPQNRGFIRLVWIVYLRARRQTIVRLAFVDKPNDCLSFLKSVVETSCPDERTAIVGRTARASVPRCSAAKTRQKEGFCYAPKNRTRCANGKDRCASA